MIRAQEARKGLFVSCEEIAEASPRSFYKRLGGVGVDWGKLAEPLRGAFSETTGRPTDPAVYLKIFLVSYWENSEYDTELADRISDSLAIREFLGYGLTERPPDHSSISRVRKQLSRFCDLESVLSESVRLCAAASLVGGESVGIDTTLIPARVSRDSLIHLDTGLKVREHLARCLEKNGEAPKLESKDLVSGSDPDARLSRKPKVPLGFHYKVTHSVDYKRRVIVSAGATWADEGDSACASAALRRSVRTLGGGLSRAVCDAGMDDAKFHAVAEELGVQALTNTVKPKPPGSGSFGKEMFAYEEERDAYRCPNGRLLKRVKGSWRGRIRYRRMVSGCVDCALREYCVPPRARFKEVSRSSCESSRERMKASSGTRAGRAYLGRRKGVVELTFAHAKEHGGLRRISTRGLGAADAKAKLGAVAWNLKMLVPGIGSARRATQPVRRAAAALLAAWTALWRSSVGGFSRRAKCMAA